MWWIRNRPDPDLFAGSGQNVRIRLRIMIQILKEIEIDLIVYFFKYQLMNKDLYLDPVRYLVFVSEKIFQLHNIVDKTSDNYLLLTYTCCNLEGVNLCCGKLMPYPDPLQNHF